MEHRLDPEKPPVSASPGANTAANTPSPSGKVLSAAAKPSPVAPGRKHGEALRKPAIRPNLREVTRTLPADEASAASPRRAAPSPEPAASQTSPTGGGKGAASSEPSSAGPGWYYSLIRERLYAAWDQPLHLSNQGLTAKIQIFVAKDGRISNPVLLNSSANEEFDRTVLAAAHQVDAVGEPRPSDVPEIVTVTFRMGR